MLEKAVFLDRDGVINADSPGYIKSLQEFRFLPRSVDAVRLLTENGWRVFVITNQSALHRGLISSAGLAEIHAHLCSALKAGGGVIDDIFFCPHRPDENCGCRKPKPGLILQARARYGIHLPAAVMIGDSAKDVDCARRAGCGTAVLVRTGNGVNALAELTRRGSRPDRVAEDLYEAVLWLIRRR